MNLRLFLFAPLLCCCLTQSLPAAVVVFVNNTGQEVSTQTDTSGGTLSFRLTTFNDFVNTGPSETQTLLTMYGSFDALSNNTDFVNATLDYDLDIIISDPAIPNPADGTLGTVNIGGLGIGGYSPALPGFEDPFINDSIQSLKVNGTNVSFDDSSGDKATFSLAFSGGYLNFRLFDPNPDFDRVNPFPGLAFGVSETADPLYAVIAPAAVASVPEPTSAALMLGLGSLSLLAARRRQRRTLITSH